MRAYYFLSLKQPKEKLVVINKKGPMKSIINLTIFSAAIFLLYSCDGFWNTCVDGNGDIISETRDLDDFEKLQVMGDFEVDIDTGETAFAVIRADENLLHLIQTHRLGNDLVIETKNGVCLKPSDPIEIHVTVPDYSGVDLEGSGSIYSFGNETGHMEIILSGSGRIDIVHVVADNVDILLEGSGTINAGIEALNTAASLEGSGEIRLTGSTNSSDLSISGSGRIRAGSFMSQVCDAYISGSGTITTDVEDALRATIIGSGTVYYSGNPVVHTDIEGSGRVIHQ
jgi:hypothetical protein